MIEKLFLFLFLIPALSVGQTNPFDSADIVYYGKDSFLLEGTIVPDSLKENSYDRLPLSYKSIVRPPVWDLSKNSAGMSIRFLTNSSSISVKWEVLNNFTMNGVTLLPICLKLTIPSRKSLSFSFNNLLY